MEDYEITEETEAEAPAGTDWADGPDASPEPVEIPVKAVRIKGNAVLVEWQAAGKFYRGTLPRNAVTQQGKAWVCREDALAMAIPHGYPWAELIELHATPESIEAELHRVGIWEIEDLLSRPQAALGAIQAAYKFSLSTLTSKVNRLKRKIGGSNG